eukprot:TRINITY_DN29519_c0_g1_i1.p2 TRINITY_DN29519_c0_g1~~TRINITY_DN29519_c0_g1_i1.p2  ORF type:complete len:384 (-),score=97.46 TRINITY_DN29519_c0_g1_i1:147-1298(-)
MARPRGSTRRGGAAKQQPCLCCHYRRPGRIGTMIAWALAVALGVTEGLRLEIMITSKWSHLERRNQQRRALGSCLQRVGYEHDVELLFFMGDLNLTEVDLASVQREQEENGDLVEIGGPDSDPYVVRDATYVLDRPCARTYRLAHGTAWLARNRPDADYVMYLDDDSFLHLPRLTDRLASEPGGESLAMGFVMETNLDWMDIHICELCDPCEPCQKEAALIAFCSQFPEIAYGGCTMAIQNCRIFNEEEDLASCVLGKREGLMKLADYFGSKSAPRWMLGMGWVFGKRIVHYIGRNAHRLKVRGAADVSLGFWLAPLEGVRFESMNLGEFHDHPATKSTFSAACTDSSILVHRMTPARWTYGFDPQRCELSCASAEEENAEAA